MDIVVTTTGEEKIARLTAKVEKYVSANKALSSTNSVLNTENNKLLAALSAQAGAFTSIATAREKALPSLKSTISANTALLASTTKLIAAEDIMSKGLKTRALSVDATTAELSGLNAVMAKQGALLGELSLLNNKAYTDELRVNRALAEQVAVKKSLIFIDSERRAAQAGYRAEAMKGIVAAERLIGIETSGLTINKKIAAQMIEREAAQAGYRAEATKSIAVTQRMIGVQTNGLAVNKAIASQFAANTAAQESNTAATARAASVQQKYQSVIRGTAGALGGLWLSYGNVIPMIAAFAAASTAYKSVKSGAEFEYTTAMVDALAQSTGDAVVPLESLRKQLLNVKGLRKGPVELSEGMKEFSKAGVDASKAMADIAEVARFATLAEVDMATATTMVIAQTNAFGGSFGETANKISAAALSSATTIQKLAQALTQTTELGSVVGFSLSEVTTGLALLAQKGIQGTKAGTALRTSFIRLAAPTTKVTKMMKDLGIEFSAFSKDTGGLKTMQQQLSDLAAATKHLGKDAVIPLIKELSGLRAMKGLGNLLQDMNGDFGEMYEKVNNAAEGTSFLVKTLALLDDTTVARWESIKSIFQADLISMTDWGIVRGVLETLLTARQGYGMAISAVSNDVVGLAEQQAISAGKVLNNTQKLSLLFDVILKKRLEVAAIEEQLLEGTTGKVTAKTRIALLRDEITAYEAQRDAFSKLQMEKIKARKEQGIVTKDDVIRSLMPPQLKQQKEKLNDALLKADLEYAKELVGVTNNTASEEIAAVTRVFKIKKQLLDKEREETLKAHAELSELDPSAEAKIVKTYDKKGAVLILQQEEALSKLRQKSAKEQAKVVEQRIALGKKLVDQSLKEEKAVASFYKEMDNMRFGVDHVSAYDREVRDLNATLQDYLDKLAETEAKGSLTYQAAKAEAESVKEYIMNNDAEKLRSHQDMVSGIKAGLLELKDESMTLADVAADSIKGAFESAADAVAKFATTGKLNFRDFASSVLRDMAEMYIRQQSLSFMQQAVGVIGGLASSAFGGGGSTNLSQGTATPAILNQYANANAKGNVHTGKSISAYSNSVVDKPTFFAKGGNVMGEAGPEAIMPLTRTSNGDLGVKVEGVAGATLNVVNNITVESGAGGSDEDKNNQAGKIANAIKQEVRQLLMEEKRYGGLLFGGTR